MKKKKEVKDIEVIEPIIVMSEPMPKIIIEEKPIIFIEENIVKPKSIIKKIISYFNK